MGRKHVSRTTRVQRDERRSSTHKGIHRSSKRTFEDTSVSFFSARLATRRGSFDSRRLVLDASFDPKEESSICPVARRRTNATQTTKYRRVQASMISPTRGTLEIFCYSFVRLPRIRFIIYIYRFVRFPRCKDEIRDRDGGSFCIRPHAGASTGISPRTWFPS